MDPNFDAPTTDPGDLGWNPYGDHSFSISAAVTKLAMDGGGAPGPAQGSVTGTNAVLVDLDVDQQGVSQIFGMQITVTVGAGSVSGTFVPVNFVDLFGRVVGGGGDSAASAAYQSVLANLTWNESGSPFLIALKKASPDMLSIRFNVDGFNDGSAGLPGPIHQGRVAGTIGPYYSGEPTSFTNARFLRPTGNKLTLGQGKKILPVAPFNFAPAKTNHGRGTLTVDLGNALPTTWSSGPAPVSMPFNPQLQVATVVKGPKGWTVDTIIGSVDSAEATYENTAFVFDFALPPALLKPGSKWVTGVCAPRTNRPSVVVMAENPTGAYINADQYVFRVNPDDTAKVTLWANTFEQAAAGAQVALQVAQLGSGPATSGGVSASSPAVTDKNGQTTFTLSASDPGNPRGAIDGQVYSVNWTWAADVKPDPNAFLSVRVFDTVTVPAQPAWWTDIFPILNQYSWLYWRMWEILNINDFSTVAANVAIVVDRLTRPLTDSQHMPITRDLSADKLAILLKWAKNPIEGPPPVPPVAPFQPPPQPTSGSGQ